MKAEALAKRPYFRMTAVDATTEGHPIYFAHVTEMEGCFGQGKILQPKLGEAYGDEYFLSPHAG